MKESNLAAIISQPLDLPKFASAEQVAVEIKRAAISLRDRFGGDPRLKGLHAGKLSFASGEGGTLAIQVIMVETPQDAP